MGAIVLIQTKSEIGKIGSLPDSEMRLSDLFITLSRALDMGNSGILKHSRRVAYIAYEIAVEMDLEAQKKNEVVLAALIHDIGIVNFENKEKAQNFFQIEMELSETHCKLGSDLTKRLNFFPGLTDIINYHHHKWDGNNFDNIQKNKIPLASRIIYLADRIEAIIDPQIFILNQSEDIIHLIKSKSGSWFDPNLIKIFTKIAQREFFWLNLESEEYNNILANWGKKTKVKINLSDLESLASIVAHLIDRISPFTSRHSSGVATIAAMLAHELKFNLKYQRALRTAGLFHDLGKLIVPNEIIEKNDQLTDSEFQIIKQHTFYTYKLLNKIEGLGSIPEWAAFHHERLDGSGYPFKIKGEDLSSGCKIMAVSDVFQALTEDRPYRSAFSISKALEIIDQMQQDSKLDKDIIDVLKNSI